MGRAELLTELRELAVSDPRSAWEQARAEGRAAGIDEVFHFFFFDDHDFNDGDIGFALCCQQEGQHNLRLPLSSRDGYACNAR